MELYLVRAFLAVASTGHLTRAAERLHASQPAVSGQIKAFEEKLGMRLFERTSNGMVLTRSGRELLGPAEKLMAASGELLRAARAIKGELSGRLRIGTLSDPGFIRVGEVLSRAVERHPLIELELHHEISGAALEAVRDGTLDASYYFGELSHPEVAGLALGEVVYRVAAPAAWGDRVRQADWNELAAMPWILTPAISTHHHLVRTLFEEHGTVPSKVIEADNEGVIVNLVESGLGLSLVREDLVHGNARAPGICVWEKTRLRTPLWFIYQSKRAQDPLIIALLAILGEAWRPASRGEPEVPPRPVTNPVAPGNRCVRPAVGAPQRRSA
ncbi:MAG: LysR family transcriptional regulator [Betaproteobacteria bacterium]|nr:LysR family transcriptional regulator [Betaproteobacteria bacterium]